MMKTWEKFCVLIHYLSWTITNSIELHKLSIFGPHSYSILCILTTRLLKFKFCNGIVQFSKMSETNYIMYTISLMLLWPVSILNAGLIGCCHVCTDAILKKTAWWWSKCQPKQFRCGDTQAAQHLITFFRMLYYHFVILFPVILFPEEYWKALLIL